MRCLRNCLVALVLGISAPVLIWVGAGSALYQRRKAARAAESLSCSLDADCPPGHICLDGICVPADS